MADSVVEILILKLKPGTREQFQRQYLAESLPLHEKWKIEVVAHGPSRHDENSYYVIRSFKSLEDRQAMEAALYNSTDWQQGPRSGILSLIENLSALVVPSETIKGWAKLLE